MLRKTVLPCLGLLFLFGFVRVNAQVAPGVFADANSPSGPPDPMKPGDIWHVDPIGGTVSITVPFTTTPQGGRGPKLPFQLFYNSGSTMTLQANGGVVLGDGSINIFNWSPKPLAFVGSLSGPSGPWTTTGPYFYSGNENIPDAGFTDTNGAWHVTGYGCSVGGPYTYVDENGASHDLDLESYSANYTSPLAAPCTDAKSAATTYWPTSNTADGSAMATGNTFAKGPDGSNATGHTITDANGNSASLSTAGGVTTATDALSRTVYQTNIPIGQPGQIPAGNYYVKTFDTAGNAETYTVKFSTKTVGSFSMPHPTTSEISTAVYCIGASCPNGFTVNQPHASDNFSALTEIDLPNGSFYKFDYDSTYGTISKITFPTGGYVRFLWSVRDKDWNYYGQFQAISDIVATDAYVSTGSGENHWLYSLKSVTTSATPAGTVTAPDGSRTDFTGTCFIYTNVPLYQHNARPSCKENSRAIYSSAGKLLKTVTQAFNSHGMPATIATTFYDASTSLQQQVKNTYDAYDNVLEKDETNFYSCSPAPCATNASPTWIRKTFTTYAYTTNSALASAHIVDKPSQVVITDGNGNPASLTSYTYDGHGNVLTEHKCITITGTGASASCSSFWETKFTYDATGQVTSKIEGNNTAMPAPTTYSWGLLNAGFLTSVTHPNGAIDTYDYYTSTGQVKTHKDWNGQTTGLVTSYAYDDPGQMHRITSVTNPQTTDGTTGSAGYGTTTYRYNDTAGTFSVQEQHTVDTSGTTTSVTKYFDGLGREKEILKTSPQCAAGIKVDTEYDSMSHVYRVTDPYCSTSDPTYVKTIYLYDALSRKTQTTFPDGAVSTVTYAGDTTLITDPSNGITSVQHLQLMDGLGRLIKVCEVSSTSLGPDASLTSCGMNIAGTGYVTSYVYNVLDHMVSVNQHGISRSFSYDSLARLTQSLNPETGSSPDLYTYSSPAAPCAPDPNVPCTRTDARGVKTTYQYDSTSRLKGKSYSTVTPNTTGAISDLSSCYQYDTPLSGVTDLNPKGHLTAEWQQAGTCPTTAVTTLPAGSVAARIPNNHDAMGRTRADQQCLTSASCSSTVGDFVYSYNLMGGQVQANNGIFASTVSATQIGTPNGSSISAPSLTWKTTYDYAPHISQVLIQDQPGTAQFPVASTGASFSSFPTLLNAISYDPFDHMIIGQQAIPYGSSTPGLSISRQYDVRGRVQSEGDQGNLVSSPAHGSAGSITIAGSEKSNTQSGTAATATVGIIGSEQSTTYFSCPMQFGGCPVTIYDSGSDTIYVNGVSVGGFGWSQGSSSSAIAASLASAINGNSSAPVTASASGSTVTLTSKTTGSGGNYPISVTSSGWNTTYFSSPSFTVSAPSAMTGGTTGGTTYDSGTVSATINSKTATVSFGSGSTSSSVASALASAISSTDSAFLTASAAGSVVNLTSLGTGSATNWSVLVSVTYDTAHFSSASYTATPINMSGGSDGSSSYSTIYSYQVPATGGYAPNGNLLQFADSVMGTWSFGYDGVDRLTSSHQTASTSTSTQYATMYGCWSYDTRGNRTTEAISTTNCTSSPTPQTVTVYSANNQISSTTLSANTLAAGSFIYDASGNTLYDGLNEYWYDAEGQLCAVQSLRYGAGPVYQYAYDPGGVRIAKGTVSTPPAAFTKTGSGLGSSPTCAPPSGSNFVPTTRYLVDQGGQQVTELNLTTGKWQHSNIFVAGKLSATYDTKGLHFALSDPLGTKRLQANIQGQPDDSCTSLPFGNDINNPVVVNCTQSANSLQTNDDATEHHFTQKERDTDTGNDYFFARYYTSALGRFMTPDWSAKTDPVPYAAFTDPQSLNLYAYVRNNPLTRWDTDGHGCKSNDFQCQMSAAWNSIHAITNSPRIQTIKADMKTLNNSTKITVEAGFGFKESITSGPLELHLGATIHDEKTYTGDDTKLTDGEPIKDKAEVDIGAKVSHLELSVEGNVEHTAGSKIEGHIEPKTSLPGENSPELSKSGERINFGVASYSGIGGGVTMSFDQKAFTNLIKDVFALAK